MQRKGHLRHTLPAASSKPLEPTILSKAHPMSMPTIHTRGDTHTNAHTYVHTHTHWCHSTCTYQHPPLFGLGKTELTITVLFSTAHLKEVSISLLHCWIIPWYSGFTITYVVSTIHNWTPRLFDYEWSSLAWNFLLYIYTVGRSIACISDWCAIFFLVD